MARRKLSNQAPNWSTLSAQLKSGETLQVVIGNFQETIQNKTHFNGVMQRIMHGRTLTQDINFYAVK